MIKKFTLTNWRNYENVEIELGTGTTFVVASNGVGKSSLVEAARFALFGTPSTDSASPIRAGSTIATAKVELALPNGDVIEIERTLTEGRGRPAASVVIQRDGETLDEDAFERIIRTAYGAESSFLSRLTMPAASRQADVPTALGLQTHLGRYFGVDGLQQAIDALKENLKSTEKQIKQIKVGNAATALQIADLEAAVTAATEAAENATREHAAAQAEQDNLRAEVQARRGHATWLARRDQWWAQLSDMLETATQEFGEDVGPADVEARLSQVIEKASSVIEDARIHIAVQRSRADLIRTNQVKLDASDDNCPVCRRPLDDATIALAHRSNDAEIQALEAAEAALLEEERSAVERRDRAQALWRRWREIPAPGPEPEIDASRSISSEDLDEAAQAVSVALDRLVSTRAGQVDAESKLRAAREADDAMRTLEVLFRAEAEIRVALNATTATREELLEHIVGPLASEVNQRWADLFPGRGSLATRADATITRIVNGNSLPFDAFSTGESIGATIVLRLLVAQMVTTADFCWFDEPLEHLDPNIRRQVANILAGAASADSRLRQVVVTTYEEPLARQLQQRAPEDVRLVDVRSAPVSRMATDIGTSRL